MQNAFFKLFWFDFDRCFCADREKRPLARSFVVEQILSLFFWPPQAFKVVPYFSFHRCPIVRETWPHSPYSRTLRRVALPRWRVIGVEWSAFHRKRWPRYRVRYKVTQLQNEELDLCRLIVKIDLGLASSWLFPSINFQFRTETFLSIFLGWLKWPARFWEVLAVGNNVKISIQRRWACGKKNPRNPSKTIVMPTCEQNDQKKWLVEGISKITRTANR